MQILGVDHGSVRVGLAISDDIGMLAVPLETVENTKAIDRIAAVVAERKVQTIIVGMPRNMDGTYGPKAEEVRKFVEELKKKVSVEIKFWDERWSTKSAERLLSEGQVFGKKRKAIIDQVAAQQILQSYLDSKS